MNYIYEVKHSYIYNLDLELNILEKYLIKLGHRPKLGLYVKGNRFPFTHEEHGLFMHSNINNVLNTSPLNLNGELPNDLSINIIDKNDMLLVSGYTLRNRPEVISTVPHHPVLVVDFLRQLVDYLQYTNCDPDVKELYYKDVFNKTEDYLIDPRVIGNLIVEDIVVSNFEGLVDSEIEHICDIVNAKVIPMIQGFMAERNMLYTLDLNSNDIILRKHNDIRAVRYMKLYDDTNYSKYLEQEYRNNV